MSWSVYGILGWTVLVASILVTAACLVRGWRRERAGGAAWICVLVAIGSVVFGFGGTIAGLLTAFGAVEGADAASTATLLAQGISEAMNSTAFGLAAMLPPAIAAVVLFVRAPSKRGPSAH
jgi:hypothetical protein